MKLELVKGNFINNFKTAAIKKSPAILIGFGIAGFFGSMVLVGRAAPEAAEKIEEKKKELKKEKLTPIETVQTVWTCYIPAAVLSGISMGMILGGYQIDARRNAVLAAAYGMTETAFKEYREKTLETIGEKKEKEIQDQIAKDHVEKNPVSQQNVIYTGRGNHLCYETLTGRYFYSNIEKVKSAVINLGKRIFSEMYISQNEYYQELGLPSVKQGDDIGWNNAYSIVDDVTYSSQLTDIGEPCLVIDYLIGPSYEFKDLH